MSAFTNSKFHQKIKRLPAENLLSAATTDITRRAIELTQNILRENDALTEEQALNKAIETLKTEGFIDTRKPRQRRSRETKPKNPSSESETSDRGTLLQASATEESTQTLSGKSKVRSLVKDYENAVKEISDKGVDISNIFKDDK